MQSYLPYDCGWWIICSFLAIWSVIILTRCGLVTSYGDNLGQHWLRKWFVAWRHEAISCNIALSKVFCAIHLLYPRHVLGNYNFKITTTWHTTKWVNGRIYFPWESQYCFRSWFCQCNDFFLSLGSIFTHYANNGTRAQVCIIHPFTNMVELWS